MEIKFIARDTAETLEESLKKETEISDDEFIWLISFYYSYYGYDSRCKEIKWILKKPQGNLPTWIGIKLVNSTGKPDVR